MPEYNLNNPSVREEEQMIQDRIDEEYAMIESYYRYFEEEYYKAMENEYYKAMENEYYKAMEE